MNDQFLSQEVIFEMVQLPFYLVLYLKKDYSVFVLLEKTLKTINHPNFSVRLVGKKICAQFRSVKGRKRFNGFC